MPCKNCKCGQKKVKQVGIDESTQKCVVEGLNYLHSKGLTVHESDFGKRRFHFVYEVGMSVPEDDLMMICIGLVIHNPSDKFSRSVGNGLAGYFLKYLVGPLTVTVRRKSWKSLNSKQKTEFVENHLRNLCMMDELPISRRTAMGGR